MLPFNDPASDRAPGWHDRRASSKHQQWFRSLSEIHEITNHWISELKVERPSHALARGLSGEVAENLWMLESLSGKGLEPLLDDTQPSDLLGRLERTVWSVHAWTLMRLVERAAEKSKDERLALLSVLQQAAWKVGRRSGEVRWPRLPREAREDVRGLMSALVDSPFVGNQVSTVQDLFLIRRALAHEAHLELKHCPHQSPFAEIKPAADELCLIHSYFLRGFLYALNSKVSIDHRLAVAGSGDRCWQRWFFVS